MRNLLDKALKLSVVEAGIVAYSSCKVAVAQYVRANAKLWGEKGVRLNCVALAGWRQRCWMGFFHMMK